MAAFHNNGSCLDFKKQTQIVLCLWSDIFDFVWYCCVTLCYYSISLVGVVNLCCFGLNQWKVSINIIHTSILSCFSCCLCCQPLKTHLVAGNYKKSSHAAWKENVFLVLVQADGGPLNALFFTHILFMPPSPVSHLVIFHAHASMCHK